MFIGHYGVALGAHALFPQVPLPVLAVATQAIDMAWAALVLAEAERVTIRPGATATTPLDLHHMPYSHSLAGAAVISLVCMAAAMGLGLAGGAAWVVGAVAFSHWLLDLAVHDRTLIVIPGQPKAGFGLWQNRPVSVLLEYAIILAGVAMYWVAFAPLPGTQMVVFWAFSGCALLVQTATFFGPPPRTTSALVVSMLTLFALFTGASFWLDHSGIW